MPTGPRYARLPFEPLQIHSDRGRTGIDRLGFGSASVGAIGRRPAEEGNKHDIGGLARSMESGNRIIRDSQNMPDDVE